MLRHLAAPADRLYAIGRPAPLLTDDGETIG
jgi:hypothetical protein